MQDQNLNLERSFNILNRISESDITISEYTAVQSLIISELERNQIAQEDINLILCEFNIRFREIVSQSFLALYEQV